MHCRPPALWVVAPGYCLIAAVSIEYVRFTLMRIKISEEKHVLRGGVVLCGHDHGFIVATHLLFLFSSVVFCLVFVIHPWVSLPGHTRPFELYIVSRFLVVLSVFYEDYLSQQEQDRCTTTAACNSSTRDGKTRWQMKWLSLAWWKQHSSFAWLGALAITSLSLPIIFEMSISDYQSDPGPKSDHEPLFPWWFVAILDYGWVACTAFTTKFLPDRPIVIGHVLLKHETVGLVGETLGDLKSGKLNTSTHKDRGTGISRLLVTRLRDRSTQARNTVRETRRAHPQQKPSGQSFSALYEPRPLV